VKTLICIPTYRGAHRVAAAVQSILKWTQQSETPYEIVLGDDGSPDRGEALKNVGRRYGCAVICHDKNRGIPAIWNTLFNSRDYPYKVMLNDDILVTEHWLTCMRYFLQSNPHAAGAGWSMYFTVFEDYPQILMDDSFVVPRDPITKIPTPEKRHHSEGQRPGRVMCPVGSCFALTQEKWKTVGEFDERFLSFHEESDFFTRAASLGLPSYGLTYPAVWHLWSQTFRENPELNAGWRMQHSRKLYCEKWKVPQKYWDRPFDWTNPLLLAPLPPNVVKWLDPGLKAREELEPRDTRIPPEE